MSALLMGQVFYLDGLTSTQKLVLLALADNAHDDGANCYPSVATISAKASISHRHAQRTLSELEDLGLVVREISAAVGSKGQIPAGKRPNLYTLHIPGVGVTPTSPHDKGVTTSTHRGDTQVTPGVSPTSGVGVTPTSPRTITREPSDEPRSPTSSVSPREAHPQPVDDVGVEEQEQRTTTHPAVRILQPLGIVGAEPTEGERQTVGRALEQGWTTDQLTDLAHIAASKEEPRSYLQGMLTKRANTNPTAAPAANGTAPVALAPGADWLAKWAKARTMTRASGEDMIRALGEPAGRALHEIRQIARYDTEVTAKQAFRACYLEQLNQETP